MGFDYDIRKDIYQSIGQMNLKNLQRFHKNSIQNRNYSILVIGKEQNIDFNTLKSYGKLKTLTLEDIFNY